MHTDESAADEGFTLVEVIVAMLVFAIVMTGFLYTVTASMVTTRDTRARVVAANLAAQQIDLVRASGNVFDVTNQTLPAVTMNGDTFHVKVKTSWITDHGATASCETGAATGSLSYKQVTVEVTWDNMRGGATPVRSDTAITPKTKINNPTLGTVLVGVIGADGSGVSGIPVSLTPSNGVAAATTDSDGCAYLLKVPADTYTVSIAKSGYVGYANDRQFTTPTATVPVTAGSSSRISFAFDRATTVNTRFASNATGSVKLPTDLTASFLSTYGTFSFPVTGVTQPFALFPFPSGYSIVAGPYAESPADPGQSCLAPDPGEWEPEPGKTGTRPAPVAGTPGGSVSASVPMGSVSFSGANGSGNYLKAVYVGGGAGDPGCATTPTYRFGDVIRSNSATIALPYGTWKLYRGSTSGTQNTQITGGTVTVTTGGSASGGTIVLDPRVAG